MSSRAAHPDGDAGDDPAAELAQRRTRLEGHALADDAELAGRHGQHEHDDRRGDAVVEPALDVERTPKAQRDPLVVDDLHAEGGIGRRQCGAHEAGQRPRQAAEDPAGEDAAEDHRQDEADRRAAGRGCRGRCRSSARFTRAASENSTSASVTSATRWTERRVDVDGNGPQSGFART